MPPHPLTNFEIQKYYQSKSKFSDFYLRNNLPKIKNGAYIINLDKQKSIGTLWIALKVNDDNVTYVHIFGVDYIPNKNLKISKQIFTEYK